MKKILLITLFAIIFGSLAAQAQSCTPANPYTDRSGWVQWCSCMGGHIEQVGGNPACVGVNDSSGGNSSSAGYGLPGAMFQLGYAFGRWLFGGNSNPAADAARQQQEQQMMEELARREAEAERQHREEEARRLAEMYNRLLRTLKLRGLPDLQLKERAGSGPGLQLKLRGDDAPGHAPGFYQDSQGKWYLKGIDGLPGNYTGPGTEKFGDLVLNAGPGGAPSQVQTLPGLHMKTRDNQSAEGQNVPAPAAPDGAGPPGGQPPASGATMDPSKMTPQQLADAADAFSRLSPEQQQQIQAAVQQNAANPQTPAGMSPQPNAGAVNRLAQQAETSQAAASQQGLEAASAQARVGFDTSGSPPPGAPPIAGTTPGILHQPEAALPPHYAEPPAPGAPSVQESGKVRQDLMQLMFPGPSSPAASQAPAHSFFPRDPNPPLLNPLREEQKVQEELKMWDDWATQQAIRVNTVGGAYRSPAEERLLNTSAVKDYAPDLLDRYNSDAAFRANVDQRLESANGHISLDYYQGIADAHKAAILEYQAELKKLADANKLDLLTPLDDQYRMHPERRALVAAVWRRVSADEQAAEDKARSDGQSKLDKEYKFVFQLVRGQAAQ
jgi:hypothetical protein